VNCSRPYDILVVGELNVDIVVRGGDIVPRFGQAEQIVDDLSVNAGSSGAIFAVAASKLGMRVLYGSVVGDDPFGHYMIAALEQAGVATSAIRVDPQIKTGASVMLSKGNDRAMLTYLGSIAALNERDVDHDWFRQARHLHVVSPFLMSGLRPYMPTMMRLARQGGMTVSLDTNWDPDEQWLLDGFFEHLDLFLPNEQELRAISGEASLKKAIAAQKARVETLVVKRGGQGAIALRGEERIELPADRIHIADTTGAGDTFDAGFLSGWLRGMPLEECLRLGIICGGMTATQIGGFNGQPTWKQALARLR